MKKLFTAIQLILVAFILWTAPQVEALSCAPPRPVKEEMDRSTVVFKGKAVEIKKDGLTVFRIDEAWKGVETPQLEIYHNGWDPFIKDTVYLVFGSVQEGMLRMNLCGRTGPWDNAREAAMKDSGIKSIKPGSSMEAEQFKQLIGYTIPATTVIIAVVLLLLVLVLIRRKRKQ
ncbi:hypothetical protein [Paenibacillus sp. LHD-38]|uniref:hypothetical protein n=1 Tax=Paenibacillus sp. LHD-38 TaxID=3072143 RepID=UPI00280E6DA4|nr:hypothetical protein [Paenibacillus sp. LHD-38]MDQ8739497.1 hypothetical protein [Paenibacillus sp. LHD-38]